MKQRLSIFFLLSFLMACNKKNETNTSFYYWKTNYRLSKTEKDFLLCKKSSKIYIRCFDINIQNNLPMPLAVLQWQDEPLKNINYIPVVFITNEVFEKIDYSEIKTLSEKIHKLVTTCFDYKKLPATEIQIDCDWTKTTKEKYFLLLRLLKQKKIMISSTLRLHQYKYHKTTGIPPVDYCTLMCYNMGNLKDNNAQNSILNLNDLKSYTNNTTPYPLPANIALPIFEWYLLYSKDNFKGILYTAPNFENTNWKKLDEIKYICTNSYFDSVSQYFFIQNQTLRAETIDKTILQKATQHLINKKINSKNEIIYFDLDSTKIQKFFN